jgi:hypothetical protein
MKTHIALYCSILLFGASSIFAGMDDARLKERLKGGLFELLVWDNYDIDKAGVSAEQFHRVLMELYDEASGEKKAAIIVALLESVSREEGKIEFMKVDTILAERSAAYRLSRERLAMLEHHSMEPPTANLYTDRDLKAALAESRNYKQYTIVSTNLASLTTRDFNLPQPGLLTNDVDKAVREDLGAEPETAGESVRGPNRYVFFGILTLCFLGFGAWWFMRK